MSTSPIDIRRLVTADFDGIGPRIVVPEFEVLAAGALLLGILALVRGQSAEAVVLGVVSIGLGLNYVPVLLYAIDLVRREPQQAATERDAGDDESQYASFRRQSLWLLVPYVVAFVALRQLRIPAQANSSSDSDD
jgi:hypothetical protein